MTVLETLVLHGSGWLEAADASGVQGEQRRPLPLSRLGLRLTRAPADLRLVPQASGRLVLWREQPAGLRRLIDGEAAPAQRVPPAEAGFTLAGEVADPRGEFLPRRFSLDAGGGTGVRLRLYRSAAGTACGREGGLYGRVATATGQPVPWAVLTLQVVPPLADPLVYRAQADATGEFRLALQRLPIAARGTTSYPATLRVRAAAGAPDASPDPDTQPTARLRTGAGADPVWGDALTIDVHPGRLVELASPGQPALIVQPA